MSALVTGVSLVSLVVNQRSLQRQYHQMVESQLAGRIQTAEVRQKVRLDAIFERVEDGLQNPRIAAGFSQIDDPVKRAEQLYSDLGLELAPLLDKYIQTPRAFFRLFDSENKPLTAPEETNGISEKRITTRLTKLLAPLDAEELEPTSGFLAFEVKSIGTLRIFETVIHPIFDEFDGTFLGTVAIAIPINSPKELLGEQPEAKSALLIAGRMIGDSIPLKTSPTLSKETRMVGEIDGERYEIFDIPMPQADGFDSVRGITTFSLADVEEAQKQLRRSMLIFALGALAAGLAISYVVSGQISKPVSELTRQTKEILAGNLGATIPIRTRDEIGTLTEAFNEMSEGLALKEKYRAVLDRVTDPKVAEELTRGELELGGEEREATVLFCDIRGFTTLTEDMTPSDVVAMLNEHMTILSDVVTRHNGVVDKFVGDEIMVIFGAPKGYDNDALDAVRCAFEMMEQRAELNRKSDASPIEMGIGIATGSVLVGCMGSENRLNYTVLGARVNLAARLCSRAASMEILIDNATCDHVRRLVKYRDVGDLELKGFREKNSVHQVIGMA